MGGLDPRSQAGFYENSDIKPPWMRIAVGWVNSYHLISSAPYQYGLPDHFGSILVNEKFITKRVAA